MNQANAHQQLLNTQCGGLSSCWARAAREEAREAAHRKADEPDAAPASPAKRAGRLGTLAGVAGLAFAAGAAGLLVLWMSALPMDAKASAVDQAQAVSAVRSPA
jgi:ferric-dicitrate binding protein FerR (iron transport regulator)